ncbi:MAG: IS200/IS605 family transposase [Deltaproteobacteria bacterium]|jgi:REP element-mobilizing transposase RayT|nr:IS200/IS605 family transposase [Deltaproteobacteria bacterium]
MGRYFYSDDGDDVTSDITYHFVCPLNYRQTGFGESIGPSLKLICQEIEKRHDIKFLEVKTDPENAHFFVQSEADLSPDAIVKTIKDLTAREIVLRNPDVKNTLLGAKLWTDDYFVQTVSEVNYENAIKKYLKAHNREREYKKLK